MHALVSIGARHAFWPAPNPCTHRAPPPAALVLGVLPDSWSRLTNLKGLDLRENQISGNLPSSWSRMVSLESLDLSFNQLTGTIPQTWVDLPRLDAL